MKRSFSFVLGVVIASLLMVISAAASNYDTAIDLYNEGVNLHDNNPDAALKKYQESLKYDTSIGEVYLNIGLIYINKGDLDTGEEYTLKAYETFVKTKTKVSADQTLERLVAICENNIAVINLRRMDKTSDKTEQQRLLEEALVGFLWALEFDPSYDTAWNNYKSNLSYITKTGADFYDDGVDFLDQEKNDDAIVRFKIALDLDKTIGEAYLNAGLAYLRVGDYDSCEKWSKDAINTFKKYKKVIASGQTLEELIAICYLNMGLAYIGKARDADSQGNTSQANTYHKTALSMFEKGMAEDPTYSHIKDVYNQYKNSYK